MENVWEIPKPLAIAEIALTDGATSILRRHGNPDGPRLVLCHGNGLATDLYYPFWSLLADRFDIVLYDLRNHGWSSLTDIRTHNIATFVSDNERIFEGIDRHFGEKPKIGVFHSLSAVVALNHEPPGEEFAALVLFDPPIYPPSGDPLEVDALWRRSGIVAQMRQEWFASREDFADMLRRLPTFGRLEPGVVDLFAETTLRPASSGRGCKLRCPREYESCIFEYSFAYNFEPKAHDIACPIKVVGGDPTTPLSFLPSMDLTGLAGLDYDFVPETTHFLQLENPQECADIMLEFLEDRGVA